MKGVIGSPGRFLAAGKQLLPFPRCRAGGGWLAAGMWAGGGLREYPSRGWGPQPATHSARGTRQQAGLSPSPPCHFVGWFFFCLHLYELKEAKFIFFFK